MSANYAAKSATKFVAKSAGQNQPQPQAQNQPQAQPLAQNQPQPQAQAQPQPQPIFVTPIFQISDPITTIRQKRKRVENTFKLAAQRSRYLELKTHEFKQEVVEIDTLIQSLESRRKRLKRTHDSIIAMVDNYTKVVAVAEEEKMHLSAEINSQLPLQTSNPARFDMFRQESQMLSIADPAQFRVMAASVKNVKF